MPKLPDVSALGPRPTPSPTRPLSDPASAGRGVASAARSLSRYADSAGDAAGTLARVAAGGALVVRDVRERRQEELEKVERQRFQDARARWASALVDLDRSFLADTGDPAGLGQRYEDALANLRGEFGGELRSDYARAFDQEVALDVARAQLGMARVARAAVQDRARASMSAALESNRVAFLEAPDIAQRQSAAKSAKAAVDAALAGGAVDEETAGAVWSKWQADTAADRVAMMDDAAALKILRTDNALSDLIDPAARAKMARGAEQRLEAEAARRLVETRQRVEDALWLLDRGRVPDNLAAVKAEARGTAFEAPLAAAEQDRETVEEFARLPLLEQASALRLHEDPGDRRSAELGDRMARLYAGNVAALRQGQGLALAVEAGAVGELVPVEWDNPDSLRHRATQAAVAARWLGQPVSPLTPAEADALGAAIEDGTAGDVTVLLGNLHDGLGQDQAEALAGAVAKDRPELAAAISLAGDAPLVARDILNGGRLLRQHSDVAPSRENRQAAVAEVYGDLFEAAPGALGAFLDAGTALYAARRVPGGDLSYDEDLFAQSLSDVAGGVVEFNGRRVLPPVPGMTESEFEALMSGLSDADLERFGTGKPVFADGSAFSVEMFERGFLATDAQLVTSGLGKYLLFMPGLGYALGADGRAYELDLRRAVNGV